MGDLHLFYFISECLTLSEYPERRNNIHLEMTKENFPWERFVLISSTHFVLPALYAKFRDADLLAAVPDDLRDYMEELYNLNLERNKQILLQLGEIAKTLSSEKIDSILLKGIGLITNGVYSDLGERILGDIDILVSPEDLNKAACLLLSDGYLIADDSIDGDLAHYPALYKSDKVAQVELHQFPVDRKYEQFINYKELMEQKIFHKDFPGCYLLPAETNLLINFMHSQLKDEGQYYAEISLRQLYDVYRLAISKNFRDTNLDFWLFRKSCNNYIAVFSNIFKVDFFAYKNNLRTRFYIFRVKMNLSSGSLSRASRVILFPFNYIPQYFTKVIRLLTKKQSRKILWKKMKNPAWYKSHLEQYIGR
jgi:hypothetical protein